MQCTYFALPLDDGELQAHLGILGILRIKIIEYTIINTINTYTIVVFLHRPKTEILLSVRNPKAGRKVKSIYLLSTRHALLFKKHSS